MRWPPAAELGLDTHRVRRASRATIIWLDGICRSEDLCTMHRVDALASGSGYAAAILETRAFLAGNQRLNIRSITTFLARIIKAE
jgi:hypothetical protein